VAGARHAEGRSPVVHGALRSAPPVHHRRRRLVPHGAGQLLIDQEPRPAAVRAGGAAARPRDARLRPAGNGDGAVTEETMRAVAALQGRRAVGAEEQLVAVGPVPATTPMPSRRTARAADPRIAVWCNLGLAPATERPRRSRERRWSTAVGFWRLGRR